MVSVKVSERVEATASGSGEPDLDGVDADIAVVEDHEDEAATKQRELAGELFVNTGHALTGVEHKEDHIGLGKDLVGTDLRVEIEGISFIGGATTSGVDERELRL